MFFTSTRFTLIPQASVASSRMARIFALMVSREVSVVSRSKSPMMLRSVVAVSYTHLDVYKRQDLHHTARRAAVHEQLTAKRYEAR